MTEAVSCLQNQWQQIVGLFVVAVLVSVTMIVLSWAVKNAMKQRLKQASIRGLWVTAAFLFVVIVFVGLGFAASMGGGPLEKILFEFFGLNRAMPGVVRCLPSGSESLWSLSAPFYFPMLYAAIHSVFLIFVVLIFIGLVGLKAALTAPVSKQRGAETKHGKAEKEPAAIREGDGEGLHAVGQRDRANHGESGSEPGSDGTAPRGPLAVLLGPLFQFFGYWLDLTRIETRYRSAVGGILFSLWLAKWLSLPAAFLGTLSPVVWILLALLVNALKDNLSADATVKELLQDEKHEAAADEASQTTVSIAALMKAIDQGHEGFELRSVGAAEAKPARTVASSLLDAGPAMRIVAQRLGLQSGLYAHQEACFTHLSQGTDVLLATAPLSGRTTVGDLLVLHRVLTLGQSVVYLCPDAESAADRRAALDAVVRKADWDWNLFVFDLCNDPPEGLDLNMRQPHVLLLTAELLHGKLLPRARDWELFLRGLGLVVVLSVESYRGGRGANFYRLMRRFDKVCADYGTRPRLFATAVPYNEDLRAYAEALLGRSLVYVGPGMDTAPEPTREIVTCLPKQMSRVDSDIPIPVVVAGTVAGLGHRAALFGFEHTLTRQEEARLAEVLLSHGKSGALGGEGETAGGLGSTVAGRLAEVVVAEADPAGVRLVTELTRHFGADLVDHSVRLDSVTTPSTSEASGKAPKGFSRFDAAMGLEESLFDEAGRAGDGEEDEGTSAVSQLQDGRESAEQTELSEVQEERDDAPGIDEEPKALQGDSEDDRPYWSQATSATVILPADQPFVKLLMAKGLVGSQGGHPYLGRGCELVTNPDNESAREKNLLCALAESSWSEEELHSEFGADLADRVLAGLREQGLVTEEDRVEIHRSSGAVRRVSCIHYVGHPLPHESLSMDTVASQHVTVRDRHTKETLFRIDRVRAFAEVYPGMVFVADRKRYRVCDPDDQTGFDEGFVYADPYERPVVTSKIRRLSVEPAHEERRRADRRRPDRRRAGSKPWMGPDGTSALSAVLSDGSAGDGEERRAEDRRKDERRAKDRRKEERRAALAHSFGGSAFFLWYPWVYLHEWVIGIKTYDAMGRMLDVTYFSRPIETRYRTKAAILAFPTQDPSKAVLHSLVHLFGHVMPAFVRQGPFDLDIGFSESFGRDELPAIFFLDRHPGDAGFARSVSPEVVKHLCYWAYRLAVDCPNHCESPTGCLGCLRSLQCHEPHGGPETDLDREGVLSLIEDLLGGFPR